MFELLAAICVIALLGVPLKQWLGFKKFCLVFFNTAIVAVISGYAMMFLAGAEIPQFARGVYLASLLAGIVFSLATTGGDKPDEIFCMPRATAISSTALLLGIYIYILLGKLKGFPAPDQFFFLYAMSVGVFGGLYFSWQNQNVTNHSVFDRSRVLPPREKIKWKRFPGTLCLLAAMVVITMAGVATVPKQHLMELYGSTGGGAWLRYIFLSYFQWDQAHLQKWMSVSLETLMKGQLWRPFTASLVHFGPLHILGNGLALYFAGKYMEPRVGTIRWLGVFFGSVWVVMFPDALLYPRGLHGGGASVGIYALAAVFLLRSFAKGGKVRSRPYEMIYMLGYVFIGNFIAFTLGHWISFVFGLAAAFALRRRGAHGQSIFGHRRRRNLYPRSNCRR